MVFLALAALVAFALPLDDAKYIAGGFILASIPPLFNIMFSPAKFDPEFDYPEGHYPLDSYAVRKLAADIENCDFAREALSRWLNAPERVITEREERALRWALRVSALYAAHQDAQQIAAGTGVRAEQ